jgi:uncharacterized protein YfaP (DUF2135 family)
VIGLLSDAMTGIPIADAKVSVNCTSRAEAAGSGAVPAEVRTEDKLASMFTTINLKEKSINLKEKSMQAEAPGPSIVLPVALLQTAATMAPGADDDKWTSTASDGTYSINGLPSNAFCDIKFEADDYIAVISSLQLAKDKSKTTKNLSLRPIPDDSNPNIIAMTLNWEDYPTDLDQHIIFAPLAESGGVDQGQAQTLTNHLTSRSQQAAHFYWADKGEADVSPYVTLDHDEMFGRGPETITFHKLVDGHYHYYVKCYSCTPSYDGKPNTEMPKAKATIVVSQGSKQMGMPLLDGGTTREYTLSKNSHGNATVLWDVVTFTVNSKKDPRVTITPHLKYVTEEPSFS